MGVPPNFSALRLGFLKAILVDILINHNFSASFVFVFLGMLTRMYPMHISHKTYADHTPKNERHYYLAPKWTYLFILHHSKIGKKTLNYLS